MMMMMTMILHEKMVMFDLDMHNWMFSLLEMPQNGDGCLSTCYLLKSL